MRGKPQRHGRKAGDGIHRQRDHLAQRVIGLACETRVAFVREGDLVEADEAHQPTDEAIALRHGIELVNHPTGHQAEVARVGRNVGVDHAAEHPVEQRSGAALESGLAVALAALAIDNVIALAQLLQHWAEQFGRVLQIGIEHEHQLPAHIVQASSQRELVAVIARQVDRHDPRITLRVRADHIPAGILRSVIDQDELEPVGKDRLSRRDHPRDQRVEPGLLVIDRDHHGKLAAA